MKPAPLAGEAIVCLSSIDWDFLWQAHQEVMSRLAAGGNAVLFVENTGVRAPDLSDLPRLARRLRNWWAGVQGFRERAPNLVVLSPLLFPFPYSRLFRRINAWLLARPIKKWVGATRRASPILWTFLPTPLVNDLIDELDPSLVVYYCADNLAASSASAEAIAASERRLFERADLVFATSREIQQRSLRSRGEAHFFPFGVDFAKFAGRPAAPEPGDIAQVPHPRVGYVGGLHRWVDFELLRAAALARPGLQFVFVGPEQADVSALKGLSNIRLLGTKPHDELPAYVAAFDAALIPYRITAYTASVYPTKLNEYFAAGVPVVSTALPEVVRYDAENGGLVRIAEDAGSFVRCLDEAVTGSSHGRAARVAAARANSWDERLQKMSALIAEELEHRRSEPRMLTGVLARLARNWLAPAMAFAAAAFACGIVRWTPLPWLLAEPLRLSAPPAWADAVVVMGGGAGEAGEIGQGHHERIERAIQLRAQGYARRIVLCSGKAQAYSESEVMRAIALAKGVPDLDILIESKANGTKQMVGAAARLARQHGWNRVLLVSSPFHMRRAAMVWAKLAPDIEALPIPVERSRFYGFAKSRADFPFYRGATLRQSRALAQEAATLLYYYLRDWV